MPHWTLDELRDTLRRLQAKGLPSPTADRLGIDALRLRSVRSRDNGITFFLRTRNGVDVGSVTVDTEHDLTDEARVGLEALAPFGVSSTTAAVYWNFQVKPDRRGEGLGFLLAAAGAGWAADRNLAITGGGGLRGVTTSEAARDTYRRLATLLPHVLLPPTPRWQTQVRTAFVVSPHPDGLILPAQAALHEEDLEKLETASRWVRSTPAATVVRDATTVLSRLGAQPSLLQAWSQLRFAGKTDAKRAQILRDWLDGFRIRSEGSRGRPTEMTSTLPLLYGGPLRGIVQS
jgi:GNAT superfamily N-acetyltransferase